MPAFEPLAESAALPTSVLPSTEPTVFRGRAGHWPAVAKWSFPHIAALAPYQPVSLVAGNRELENTTFVQSTLGVYLDLLARNAPTDVPPLYLKEFDVLKQFPQLQADLLLDEIFPPQTLRSCATWIGPTHARTGLHCDFLDNLAMQITGHKRFYLVRPGVVEKLGAVSSKYDQWSTLATASAADLRAQHPSAGDFWVVDLHPGDVLFVPARWWHEVENLTPCILLSGFFDSKAHVYRKWLQASLRHGLHRLGLLGSGHCTCHPARPTPNA